MPQVERTCVGSSPGLVLGNVSAAVCGHVSCIAGKCSPTLPHSQMPFGAYVSVLLKTSSCDSVVTAAKTLFILVDVNIRLSWRTGKLLWFTDFRDDKSNRFFSDSKVNLF